MPHKDPVVRRAYLRNWTRRWRKANPDKAREAGRRHDRNRRPSEARRSRAKRYYAEHRIERLEYARNRRKTHPHVRKDYDARNREKLAQKARNYRAKKNWRKVELIRQLKSAPCQDCARHFAPICFDFDHRNPGEKSLNISKAVFDYRISLEELESELLKCDLVCACCHRLRTQRRYLKS